MVELRQLNHCFHGMLRTGLVGMVARCQKSKIIASNPARVISGLMPTLEFPTMNPDVCIPQDRLAEFCRSNSITELSVFGSALRDDFGPQSDIDLLVSFEEEAHHTLLDLIRMEEELEAMLGSLVPPESGE